MEHLSSIKKNLIDQALKTSDVLELEKASTTLLAIIKAEKLEADIGAATQEKRSEQLRFWIPIIVPLITATALIGTLVFQVQQFRQNSLAQRLANEDTQWREALAHAKSTDPLEETLSLTLIKSFFESDRYKVQAREIFVMSLSGVPNPDAFKTNFNDLTQRSNWNNLEDIAQISRAQVRFYNHVEDEVYRENQLGKAKANQQSFYSSVSPKEVRNALGENIVMTSKSLAKFLHDRPAGTTLDIHEVALWKQNLQGVSFEGGNLELVWFSECNLKGVNLSQANLDESFIQNSSVVDADLSGVNGKESRWDQTAWWRAKKIGPDLLKYLEEHSKFSEKTQYYDDNTKTYSEYVKEVERLHMALGDSGKKSEPKAKSGSEPKAKPGSEAKVKPGSRLIAKPGYEPKRRRRSEPRTRRR